MNAEHVIKDALILAAEANDHDAMTWGASGNPALADLTKAAKDAAQAYRMLVAMIEQGKIVITEVRS